MTLTIQYSTLGEFGTYRAKLGLFTKPMTTGAAGRLVLLVDDEPALRTAIGRMLRVMGYESVMASDGEQALALFKAHERGIAFVLLDLSLPRMSGPEVFDALRGTHPHLRVLFSSGHECPRELLEGGAVGFLRKPYSLTELRSAVEGLGPEAL